MNVPAIGFPNEVAAANELILKDAMEVEEFTSVCLLNPAG